MCNISGFHGAGAPDPLKLKLLHVLGRERGTDSAGIVINNKVTKEISTGTFGKYNAYASQKAEMGDAVHFVQRADINYHNDKWETYNVLQHNRKKSSGGKGLKEAHPYELIFEREDGTTDAMYFVHNGTITNIDKLCKYYDKDITEYVTDSEALADLILTYGTEPLKFYKGGAAIAYYFASQPNKLYMFKGATENYYTDKNGDSQYTEERPLRYVYLDGGIYFSSLSEQLETIIPEVQKEETVIYQALNNILMVFENGVFKTKTPIEREDLPGVTEGSLATAIGIDNPSEVWIADKITYFNTRYYLNGELADGIYNVGITGMIEGILPKTYYFFNGIWVKEEKEYKAALKKREKGQKAWFFSSDVYGDSGYKGSNDSYYFQGAYASSRVFKPRFSDYYIETDSRAELYAVYSVADTWTEGKLSESQAMVEMFNSKFNVNLSTKQHCLDYYTEVMQDEFSWETLDKYPKHLNVHYKYINKKSSRTVWTPEEGSRTVGAKFREIPKNNFTRLDNFNHYHGTTFKSAKEANTWHLATYGTEHDASWGIEESSLKSSSYGNSSYPEKDEDEYNELFWNPEDKANQIDYLEDIKLDIDLIKQQLSEEYGVILDQVIQFNRDYAPLALKGSEGKKVKSMQNCSIILTNALVTK